MRGFCLFFLSHLLVSGVAAQSSSAELIWQKDTSSFTRIRGLPGISTERLRQMPADIFDSTKTSQFAYRLGFGGDRITLKCCITAFGDTVSLGIDQNLDSVIQPSEIRHFSKAQFTNDDLEVIFSLQIPNHDETFCRLGSFKKTSLKFSTQDSTINLNPLYLQTKHYLRTTLSVDGEGYHVVAMNMFPTIGLSADFQYLITKAKVEDSAFLKILKWSQDNDTILINADKAIVARRKSETKIGFDVFRYQGVMGTFLGAKIPTITANRVAGSVLQLPTQQPGKLHLIEFWGTWCGPCVALYPRLDSLLASNPNLVTYTGIAGNDEKAKVMRYVRKKPRIHSQIFEPDANRSIISLFKIQAFPSFILVDDTGTIVVRGEGAGGFDQVLEKMTTLKLTQKR
jgi:thiol-disulfide isomerase/thioredoxin